MRVWGGQGYPNKHHKHFKVIFSITREEIKLPVKIGDKNLNLTRPNVDVQGGEWEEDEDEPHLAYPGPHARGQVTDDEVMTKQGNCSSRKPPKQSIIYLDHLIM